MKIKYRATRTRVTEGNTEPGDMIVFTGFTPEEAKLYMAGDWQNYLRIDPLYKVEEVDAARKRVYIHFYDLQRKRMDLLIVPIHRCFKIVKNEGEI